MGDRTIFIIVIGINMLMWCMTLSFMMVSRQYQAESEKKMHEFIQKCNEYWHDSYQSINKMVQMDASAMSHFIEQLSGIMANNADENEEENRK